MTTKKPKIVQPCEECDVCGIIVDAATNAPLHIGDWEQPEWDINGTWNTETYKNFPVTIRVATLNDLPSLLKNRAIFAPPEGPDTVPALMKEFTNFRNMSYPYVCIALAEDLVVGKLFLDRNAKNGIVRRLNAAIIDNVAVDPNFENRGIADKLLEFAENLAKRNGIRWTEIGVRIVEGSVDAANTRRGVDSLRLYLRRGYCKEPVYLDKEIDIHYRVYGLDGIATVRNPRYGKALVVYKDLSADIVYGARKQKLLFRKLVEGIPA